MVAVAVAVVVGEVVFVSKECGGSGCQSHSFQSFSAFVTWSFLLSACQACCEKELVVVLISFRNVGNYFVPCRTFLDSRNLS